MWVKSGIRAVNLRLITHLEVKAYGDAEAELLAFLPASDADGYPTAVTIAEGTTEEMMAVLGGIIGNVQARVDALDLDRWRARRRQVLDPDPEDDVEEVAP